MRFIYFKTNETEEVIPKTPTKLEGNLEES